MFGDELGHGCGHGWIGISEALKGRRLSLVG